MHIPVIKWCMINDIQEKVNNAYFISLKWEAPQNHGQEKDSKHST